MGRIVQILLLAALWAFVWTGGATAQTAPTVRVNLIGSDFVLPAKYGRLAGFAAPEGVAVRGWALSTLPETAAWSDADLIILDTPRPADVEAVEARIGDALRAGGAPWVRIGGGPPAFGGLPPEIGRRIAAYYAAGGRRNFTALFDYLAQWKAGGDLSAVTAPAPLGDSGYYHPASSITAPGAFKDWLSARPDRPRAAILIGSSIVADDDTAVVDALIAALDRRGVEGVAVWFDQRKPRGLVEAVQPLHPDLLINTQHIVAGGVIRDQLVELDVPAVLTFSYREGDADAWRSAPAGLNSRSAAALLAPAETWGMSDPMIISAVDHGALVPIPEQIEAVAARAARQVALRRTPNAEKRLALMFWNHPGGEANISASNLNVPRSLGALSTDLNAAGYEVPPLPEARWIAAARAMLGAFYRQETLDGLPGQGLAVTLPVARYRAWLDTLPAAGRDPILARWGDPARHWAVRTVNGEPVFVIPAFRDGALTVMPQPPRAARVGEAYHDTAVPPDHLYLAAYLWVREASQANALIHLGTHGTQEFLPGKDRGLSVADDAFLVLGDLPVIYPYIQDNVGEATQAKRRGRAVTVSHQTPPFAPAGLNDELKTLHDLIHQYLQLDEGAVRDAVGDQILSLAGARHIDADMGWTLARARADLPVFLGELHDYLHQVGGAPTPMGLHTFGRPATPDHRLTTVLQQLGRPYFDALGENETEVLAQDEAGLRASRAFTVLKAYLRDGAPIETAEPALREPLARARLLDQRLAETGESEGLLRALAGRFVRPGEGGDPVRNPEAVGGRNLYAFEPDKMPAPPAYAAAAGALNSLAAAYAAEHDGRPLTKLAITLWSSETIRTLGLPEGEILQALGLRARWDEGGRVVGLDIIPAAELGRPRIDVVVHATGVYRDQFDGFLRLLADAVDRIVALDEPNDPVAENSRIAARRLMAEGVKAEEATALGRARIFSNAPGDYGSGLPEAVRDTAGWDDPAALADPFLDRLGYVYGAGRWGAKVQGADVFAAQLAGVQAAALSRSSNLHGVLSTDHPFEYLGGLSLAVRRAGGTAPSLYITDARAGAPKTVAARDFLAAEMRSRYLNRSWIQAMKAEGYAGTLAVVDLADNLFGWQATAPGMVRQDQWQALHDVYVRDERGLGMRDWFVANPSAERQVLNRLKDAIRKGFWAPDDQTRQELDARLARIGAPAPRTAAGGFGRGAPTAQSPVSASNPTPAPKADEAAASATPDRIRGQVLQKIAPPAVPASPAPWGALILVLVFLAGGASRLFSRRKFAHAPV
ncbi:cobaltochelatase subunit CobN [Brevundimonas sp. SORGH_AS_0993]|uniref:cobaltochelatase subunit CobN n=1 Tax=Brevundimonas sp. SORGH_AS_0993 TaxID=3041794 RepID=UPI0027872ED0|nr:cobaltochelatase subunit CobN [Brevundimonas sp. SORGH_AS_0993]MDQ1153976.1 cobaltochelatase CobN [Brevundimonas sp. SORGH_AS_0993]